MDIAAARFDLIAPQSLLRLHEGCYHFVLELPDPVVTDTGVISGPLEATYTDTAFRQVANRLGIPVPYLRDRLAYAEEPWRNELAAQNVNVLAMNDERGATYRFLQTQEGLVLRAVTSDKFMALDADTALVAIIKGLQAHELELSECEMEADITVDRLRVRIHIPSIGVNARELLRDYRSPFDNRPGNELPMLFAGVEISNSDTGQGAFQVSDRAVFQICNNGMTRTQSFRKTHIGTQLEQGVVDWSQRTYDFALGTLTSQVEDAVRTFTSKQFLNDMVRDMMRAKGIMLPSPQRSVEVAQTRFKFTDEETRSVLDCLIKSGDSSAFGLGQAVTAAAQGVTDGERQAEMEATFMEIMEKAEIFAVEA